MDTWKIKPHKTRHSRYRYPHYRTQFHRLQWKSVYDSLQSSEVEDFYSDDTGELAADLQLIRTVENSSVSESSFPSTYCISGDDEESDMDTWKIKRRKTCHSRYRYPHHRTQFHRLQWKFCDSLQSSEVEDHFSDDISSDCDSGAKTTESMESKKVLIMVKEKVRSDSHYHGLHSETINSNQLCGQESMVRLIVCIPYSRKFSLVQIFVYLTK